MEIIRASAYHQIAQAATLSLLLMARKSKDPDAANRRLHGSHSGDMSSTYIDRHLSVNLINSRKIKEKKGRPMAGTHFERRRTSVGHRDRRPACGQLHIILGPKQGGGFPESSSKLYRYRILRLETRKYLDTAVSARGIGRPAGLTSPQSVFCQM